MRWPRTTQWLIEYTIYHRRANVVHSFGTVVIKDGIRHAWTATARDRVIEFILEDDGLDPNGYYVQLVSVTRTVN